DMRRRDFIKVVTGAMTWSFAAAAQQASKVWRIGVLETSALALNAANMQSFREGLRASGYTEGRNLVIEYRSADGHGERFTELAAELLHLNCDLILTRGTPAVLAAKNATAVIPIVMAASGAPVGVGAVASLAQPGNNVTGLSAFTTELESKRVEILREIVPEMKRLAALYNMSNPVSPARWEALKTTASNLRIEPQLLDVKKMEDLEVAFEVAAEQHADALIVENDGLIHANRRLITGLAIKHKLPAMYATRELVDEGGLLSYSVDYANLYFRAATFVDKIFKGAKPSDLPVEQPTKFELVVNLNAARSIGLPLAESFLLRADKVIE
ncbi:ABC transporter substrate-binding protein, partial [Bradyrhizobium sp.]|uniref:ABC transporter substrate-binding protein n=1 Tax=Bradyrhizobium sp. TaxID=376 RepID=UPI003C762C9F